MLRKNLKTLILSSALILPMTAFASQTIIDPYIPVKSQISLKKASNTRVSATNLKIKVRGSSKQSREDVMIKALYKAAELTVNANNRWFRVINHKIETNIQDRGSNRALRARYNYAPITRCGPLGCRTEYRVESASSIFSNASRGTVKSYTVILNFETGTGPTPRGKGVYLAKDIKRRFG